MEPGVLSAELVPVSLGFISVRVLWEPLVILGRGGHTACRQSHLLQDELPGAPQDAWGGKVPSNPLRFELECIT